MESKLDSFLLHSFKVVQPYLANPFDKYICESKNRSYIQSCIHHASIEKQWKFITILVGTITSIINILCAGARGMRETRSAKDVVRPLVTVQSVQALNSQHSLLIYAIVQRGLKTSAVI